MTSHPLVAYIAVVVTVTLALLLFQLAVYGHF